MDPGASHCQSPYLPDQPSTGGDLRCRAHHSYLGNLSIIPLPHPLRWSLCDRKQISLKTCPGLRCVLAVAKSPGGHWQDPKRTRWSLCLAIYGGLFSAFSFFLMADLTFSASADDQVLVTLEKDLVPLDILVPRTESTLPAISVQNATTEVVFVPVV